MGCRVAPGWRSAIRSGPTIRSSDLIRAFLERCHDFDGVPVFYEVGTTHLHRYADFGLTFAKVGEEARVDLTPSASKGRAARATARRFAGWRRMAASSRWSSRRRFRPLLPELRAVSDDWLSERAGRLAKVRLQLGDLVVSWEPFGRRQWDFCRGLLRPMSDPPIRGRRDQVDSCQRRARGLLSFASRGRISLVRDG